MSPSLAGGFFNSREAWEAPTKVKALANKPKCLTHIQVRAFDETVLIVKLTDFLNHYYKDGEKTTGNNLQRTKEKHDNNDATEHKINY